MNKLTPKQQDVLTFIQDFIKEKGYSPSVREIASGVGLVAGSNIHRQIKLLTDKGYIERNEHQPRTIKVKAQEGQAQ